MRYRIENNPELEGQETRIVEGSTQVTISYDVLSYTAGDSSNGY